MSSSANPPLQETDLIAMLDELVAAEDVQANCMFQLAIMLARISIEPAPENYKDEAAQSLLGLIRSKPKCNVVPLFGAASAESIFGPPDDHVLTWPHDPYVGVRAAEDPSGVSAYRGCTPRTPLEAPSDPSSGLESRASLAYSQFVASANMVINGIRNKPIRTPGRYRAGPPKRFESASAGPK